jgi:hypothetical protein
MAQFAGWLKAEPPPSNLDGQSSNVSISSLTDALLLIGIATLVRGGCQSGQGANFPAIMKSPPTEELHDKQPGTIDTNPAQAQQLSDLFDTGLIGSSDQFPSLGFY